jgi:hypothetical protein
LFKQKKRERPHESTSELKNFVSISTSFINDIAYVTLSADARAVPLLRQSLHVCDDVMMRGEWLANAWSVI